MTTDADPEELQVTDAAGNLPLKIAILGFGDRAERLAEHRQSDRQVRVVCVADPRPERRQKAVELFGADCRTLERGEEFYDQSLEVDGVWVISQEKTHAQLAVPALERGIPMILEKPLATSIRDAYRICEAFDRNPVPLVVPHSLRYLPSYRKAKELVDSGVLGSILHIHAIEQVDDHHTVDYYRRGSNMYRSNTTALLAKSSHDIDLINWMMGGVLAQSVASFGGADYFKPRPDLPQSCSDACPQAAACPFFGMDEGGDGVARGKLCAWNSGGEQVDHQTIIIQYENGTTVDFTLACFGDIRRPLQITGSHGTLYATPNDVRLVLYHPSSVEEFGPDRLGTPPAAHGGPDAALVQDWIRAVSLGCETASATVHESAEAVAVCVGAELAMMRHTIIEMADLRQQRPGPEVLVTDQ
ncbi:MAG: Gfo/Idh/MocA family oxidoreductase [Lentisphaeria bacterium]|jgi:predicted dehydrogenase|nr:Gfo/Idh/MocA family oxidoreductase [Lentisphaeria bacterium]